MHDTIAPPDTSTRRGHAGRQAAWAANLARTTARLEDLDWLLAQGVPVAAAIARVDWTPTAAARACRRHGRPDLALLCEHERDTAARGWTA